MKPWPAWRQTDEFSDDADEPRIKAPTRNLIGGLIGLIEGIIYLTKSDEDIYKIYQASKKEWF